MFKKTTEAGIRNIAALTREVRNIQETLGISKSRREEKGKGSVIDKFSDVMNSYLEYKKENIQKFEVMCPNCKQLFTINQEKKLFSEFPQGKLHATPLND